MNVLPNGQVLLFHLLSKGIARLDPAALTWTTATSNGKADNNSEEGAVLLPNGRSWSSMPALKAGLGRKSTIRQPATGPLRVAVVSLPNNGGMGIVPN